MNYRERLLDVYRDQFKSRFKVRETGVNIIVYHTDGDSKRIVAHLPKNDDPSQAMKLGHYIVGFLSGTMAEQAIKKMDDDMAIKNGTAVVTESGYTHADAEWNPSGGQITAIEALGRTNSQEHPLE